MTKFEFLLNSLEKKTSKQQIATYINGIFVWVMILSHTISFFVFHDITIREALRSSFVLLGHIFMISSVYLWYLKRLENKYKYLSKYNKDDILNYFEYKRGLKDNKVLNLRSRLINKTLKDYELYQDFTEFISEESIAELHKQYERQRIVQDLSSEF